MKDKKKSKKKILILCAVFCLLYIILAMRPLTTELHFSPQWTQNIFRTEELSLEEQENLIPYKLGQVIGYFTPEGKIFSTISYPAKASISQNYYCTYGFSNNQTDFFSPQGTLVANLQESGFPFFDQDKIFVFLPGGNSFAYFNSQGKKMWTYENYAPITAFSSSSNGIVAGYSDGKIVSLKYDGTVDQDFFPGGSELSVILGCDISEDGTKIAMISGHNKQRFSVAQNENAHSKIIFHEFVPNETNQQSLVKFNDENNLVYYGYKNGLGIVNLKKLKSKHISLPGNVVQIEKSSLEGMIFVLSRNKNTYTVTAIESPQNKAAEFSFEANCAFIQVRDNKLFVGRDDKISLMNIYRK